MTISIETKYNIGDSVFALDTKLEIKAHNEVLYGDLEEKTDYKTMKRKYEYKPFIVGGINVEESKGYYDDETSTYISYVLYCKVDNSRGYYGNDYIKTLEKVYEEDIFTTYDEAFKELNDRKSENRARDGW